ncbi:hypothetical protein BDR05DRAFT_950395 [Suillus weaverae]|nr:hypothetical protein BDR05DRAFT_950395 [Suillus weaverae]
MTNVLLVTYARVGAYFGNIPRGWVWVGVWVLPSQTPTHTPGVPTPTTHMGCPYHAVPYGQPEASTINSGKTGMAKCKTPDHPRKKKHTEETDVPASPAPAQAQLLAQILAKLNPNKISYDDYDYNWTVPQIQPSHLALASDSNYKILLQHATKHKEPQANITIKVHMNKISYLSWIYAHSILG